jgi:hypothetical protein
MPVCSLSYGKNLKGNIYRRFSILVTVCLRAVGLLSVVSVIASAEPPPRADFSGIYEIQSGIYTQCCGLSGESRDPLPDQNQRFVRLQVDSQARSASLTFFGPDLRTVFGEFSCALGGPIDFSFDHGFVFENSLEFRVDPGPNGLYWGYTVSNTASGLRIDGSVGTAQGNCADAPTHFTHTNVVAVPVPNPTIKVTEYSKEGALLFVQGISNWTNVIETSADLSSWTPISTNVMPNSVCPICPFIQFRDATSTNLPHRYYRTLQFP